MLGALDETLYGKSQTSGDDVNYEALRHRLVSTYTMSITAHYHAMFQTGGGMGDRSPSRLLRDMRETYPEGLGEPALEQCW